MALPKLKLALVAHQRHGALQIHGHALPVLADVVEDGVGADLRTHAATRERARALKRRGAVRHHQTLPGKDGPGGKPQRVAWGRGAAV